MNRIEKHPCSQVNSTTMHRGLSSGRVRQQHESCASESKRTRSETKQLERSEMSLINVFEKFGFGITRGYNCFEFMCIFNEIQIKSK